jgi:hypothetical protein
MDIHAGFARIDAIPGRVSFFERLYTHIRTMNRWAIPATALAALAFFAYFKLQQTPAVQAAELLRKAVAVADNQPRPLRRLRVQTRTRQFTKVVGFRTAILSQDPLAARFQSAHYNWDDPLSARSYQAWRDQLPEKTDEVTSSEDAYVIRTASGATVLASASLRLRTRDFRPVASHFEFSDHETVDISELPDELPAPAQAVAGRPGRGSPAPFPAPEAVEPAPATSSDELQVFAVLHDLGADLGDPVEVKRSGNHVEVSGIGLSANRQRQLRAALQALPNVVVHFADPAVVIGAMEPAATTESAASPDNLHFQARIEKLVGGRAQFDTFSGRLLDLNETAMSRAYALRRLAQQFPAGTTLTAADRHLLARLGREHAEALNQAAAEMETVLNPVLTSLGGSPSAVQMKMSDLGAWQPATESLFRAAQRVETLLANLLDASPRPGSTSMVPSQLLTSLAQLRSTLAAYQPLLLAESVR